MLRPPDGGGKPALADEDRPYAIAGAVTTVLGDLGAVLHLPAAMTVPTLVVALVAEEHFAVPPLLAAGGLALLVGQLLYRRFASPGRRAGVRTALAVVAIAWLVTGLLAAAVLWGVAMLEGPDADAASVYQDPLNALFEGISGATSTGLSVAHGLEADLPATVQWWRSLLQWVGAVGVIIFTLAVASTGAKGPLLLEAATRPETLGGDVRVTARRIWGLFAAMTVVAISSLLAAGVAPWEALNHGLTAIATGGFTISDDSFAAHGTAARLVGAVIIAIGAVSFVAHYQVLVRRQVRVFAQGTQQRSLALGLGAGIVLLALVRFAEDGRADVVDVVFQWTSALATAGFSTVELATWGPGALLLLMAAMAVGGSSGSTAGGLKLSRVAWLVKALATRLRAAEPGNLENLHVWDGTEVAQEHSRKAEAHAGGFALLWVATLFAGTVVVVILEPDAPVLHVAFDVSSALSNVGLDAGVAGRELSAGAKVTFSALMLLGRLEILGLVVLLRAPFVPRRAGRAYLPTPGTDGPDDAGVAGQADDAGGDAAAGESGAPDQADETDETDQSERAGQTADQTADENPDAERDVGPEHPPPGA